MIEHSLVTEDQLRSLLSNIKDDVNYSQKIFCDLHIIADSDGSPSSKTFYSSIVQVLKNGKPLHNYSVVQVRDKKRVKPYRTWENLVNSLRFADSRVLIEFREYPLEDEEYFPNL